MRKSSLLLIQTNPYLQDSKKREARLIHSVLFSSAIEGVHIAACRALGIKGISSPFTAFLSCPG